MTPELDRMPDIITAKHIAGYLHISKRRVYELMQVKPEAGGIRTFSFGASKRVDKRDFVIWLKSQKEGA